MPWRDRLRQLRQEWDGRFRFPFLHHKEPQPEFTTPIKKHWAPVFEPANLVNTDWNFKTGTGTDGWGNKELQRYSSDGANSFHTQDGHLVVRAVAYKRAYKAEDRFTSARLVSKRSLRRDKGVLTGVIQSPCAPGIWPAFWLLPKEPSRWPEDGEIDIAETWNGDLQNRTCLHFGHHSEADKHSVITTPLPNMAKKPVRYDFAWDQPGGEPGQGRLLWYIDGRPVMKSSVPPGMRRIRDFNILLNIAMGGNVCEGKVPADGNYDMTVQALYIADTLEFGGWDKFDKDFADEAVPLGKTY